MTERATLMGDWKGYPDVSLKMLLRRVTKKAMMMGDWKDYSDVSLKRKWCWGLPRIIFLSELWMILLHIVGGYKSTSWGREIRRIQTHRPHTMGSKEPEPWSPRWVRQKLREKNNGLPPNDPNHDEKPPTDVERPLCKCDLDCQSHMSLDHDMYDMRY